MFHSIFPRSISACVRRMHIDPSFFCRTVPERYFNISACIYTVFDGSSSYVVRLSRSQRT